MRRTGNGKKPLSVYIHFPYCEVKCPFCNLNAWEERNFDEDAYAESLKKEFKTLTERIPEVGSRYIVETVFMGGGTPSLFSPRTVGGALESMVKKCEMAAGAEISVEAHPLSCEVDRMKGYKAAGVNRISIGVQSFSSHKLRSLGRGHGAELSRKAVENARAAGFENISIDVIAGAPGETPERFEDDIKNAAGAQTEHVSVYALEVEKGTRFHTLARNGEILLPSEDLSACMMETALRVLRERGLTRYEISSFAVDGRRCRHNINYWRLGCCIGIGAGAHSHLTTAEAPFGLRWANPRNPSRYMEEVKRLVPPDRKRIDAMTGFSDSVMMGLRLAEGINIPAAAKKYGILPDENALDELESGGFVRTENGVTSLTEKGLPVANSVIVKIVSNADKEA